MDSQIEQTNNVNILIEYDDTKDMINYRNELTEIRKDNKHTILSSHEGIFSANRKYKGIEFNHYWTVLNNDTKEIYILMKCNAKNKIVLTIIDCNMIDIVRNNGKLGKKYVWNYRQVGYISSEIGYLHSYLLKCRDDLSVDHINQNKLDNRLCNLREATDSEQSLNKKAKTKHPKNLLEHLFQIVYDTHNITALPKHIRFGREKRDIEEVNEKIKNEEELTDDDYLYYLLYEINKGNKFDIPHYYELYDLQQFIEYRTKILNNVSKLINAIIISKFLYRKIKRLYIIR